MIESTVGEPQRAAGGIHQPPARPLVIVPMQVIGHPKRAALAL